MSGNYNEIVNLYKVIHNVQKICICIKLNINQLKCMILAWREDAMSDRRDFLRTNELIRDAYIKLLFEKNTERITVNAILDEANISRGTFYSHYRDIPDLSERVVNEIVDSMANELAVRTLDEIIEDPREPVEHILGVLMERKDVLAVVLSAADSPKIVQLMKNLFIKALQKKRLADKKMEIVDIVDACVAGAAFDACLKWLQNSDDIKKEEAVEVISDFLSGGLGKIYGT